MQERQQEPQSPRQQRLNVLAKDNASESALYTLTKFVPCETFQRAMSLLKAVAPLNISLCESGMVLLKITTPTIRKKAKISQTCY
jgi:hypothetical protein